MLGNPLWIFGAVYPHPLTVCTVSQTFVGRGYVKPASLVVSEAIGKKKKLMALAGESMKIYLILTKIDVSIYHLKVLLRKLN